MKSRRLLFLAEILALLFVLERYATANNAACVFEHIEFGTSHRCFPPSTTIPLSAVSLNFGVMGTLGGAFMNGADDPLKNGLKGNILSLYPAALIPMRRKAQNSASESLYILFKLILMPAGPHRGNLHRRGNSSTDVHRPVLWSP